MTTEPKKIWTPARVAWAVFLGTLGLSIAGTIYSVFTFRPPPRREPPPLTATGALGEGETAGFSRAMAPRRFLFPADHGPHADFRSEWWYLTGQVRAGARRFGYELTIFRQALAPQSPPRASAWATRQVYMGHLAVSDVDGGRFVATERLAREGLGLGGAQGVKVWVEDWTMTGAGPDLFPLALHARSTDPAVELSLTVAAGRGPVLQGDGGLSVKGPERGNASYYYSCTRLPTRGRLTVGGEAFDVEGSSWLDREWSTSALGPDLEGWDWLSLHLSDGRDLMVYRLRRRDGDMAAQSRATLIDARGTTQLIDAEGFSFVPRRWWRSPHTGARYPTTMTLQIPAQKIALELHPLLEDQELRLSVQYWEGAVEARGEGLTASGYLELTGYR